MLDTLTSETFAPLLGEELRLIAEALPPLTVRLIEVAPWGRGAAGRRQPFTLVVRGPGDPVAPQGIHRLDTGNESYDLFLVPIGPDEEGMRYQAVFS